MAAMLFLRGCLSALFSPAAGLPFTPGISEIRAKVKTCPMIVLMRWAVSKACLASTSRRTSNTSRVVTSDICLSPSGGRISLWSLERTVLAWPCVHSVWTIAYHCMATRPKVFFCISRSRATAALRRFFSACGSMPSARRVLASLCFSRAFARPTPGYAPKDITRALPS